jgi:hypothetical protein
MPLYDGLLGALDPPTILGSVPRRGTTGRQFFAALRDRLVGNPDDAVRIGQRLAAVHRKHFPSMPEPVSQDPALCDMRIALTRDDLGRPPVGDQGESSNGGMLSPCIDPPRGRSIFRGCGSGTAVGAFFFATSVNSVALRGVWDAT